MGSDTVDADLMRKLADGDNQALATLFTRHHQLVYALCARLCQSETAAEDVTQEVFLRLLRRAHTYTGRAQFTTWLFRVARNACLDHLRATQREQNKRQRFAAELVPEDTGPFIDSEELARLRKALQQLQPETREVLILRRYNDLAYSEIAEVCGCSVGAVRVRLHRALQALKRNYMMLGGQPTNQPVAEGET